MVGRLDSESRGLGSSPGRGVVLCSRVRHLVTPTEPHSNQESYQNTDWSRPIRLSQLSHPSELDSFLVSMILGN